MPRVGGALSGALQGVSQEAGAAVKSRDLDLRGLFLRASLCWETTAECRAVFREEVMYCTRCRDDY